MVVAAGVVVALGLVGRPGVRASRW